MIPVPTVAAFSSFMVTSGGSLSQEITAYSPNKCVIPSTACSSAALVNICSPSLILVEPATPSARPRFVGPYREWMSKLGRNSGALDFTMGYFDIEIRHICMLWTISGSDSLLVDFYS